MEKMKSVAAVGRGEVDGSGAIRPEILRDKGPDHGFDAGKRGGVIVNNKGFQVEIRS